MSRQRRRFQTWLVGGGAFVVVVICAAVLIRVGQQERDETPPSPTPTTAIHQSDGPSGAGISDRHTPPMTQPQDEQGAVDAALSYAAAPQTWLYMTDADIRAAIATIAVPEAATRIGDDVVVEVGAARSELASSAGPVWWIVHPLAWRVDRFGDAEATVSVWTFSLLSAADVAVPQTAWTTTTLDLEWIGGRWRVAAVRDTVGPTPSIGPEDQPWEPEPLDDALDGFTRLAWDDR